MDKKLHLEWEGRTLDENEDGSLTLTFSKEDTIDVASQVYAEYLVEKETTDSGMSFGDYLSDELRKAREEKIAKKYGGEDDKFE